MLALYKRLTETPAGAPKEELKSTLRASVFLVRRALRDIVTPVSALGLSESWLRCPRGFGWPGGRAACH